VRNVRPVDCPQWVINAITGKPAPAAGAADPGSFAEFAPRHGGIIEYGHRHSDLLSYAGRLRAKGLTEDEARNLFYDRWRDCVQPIDTVPEARHHAPPPKGLSANMATWASAEGILADVYARYPEGDPAQTPYRPPARPDRDKPTTTPEKILSELLDVEGLANRPQAEPLIERVLNRRSLARLNSESGAYKSFFALDCAIHIALGKDWHGHRVRRGRVVYLVGEGEEGILTRVRAWEIHHQTTGHGVLFLPRPLQTMGTEWNAFCEAMQQLAPVLIVLDTQARVTVGVNENDPSEFGEVIEHWDRLRKLTGATILALHHLNAEGGRPRGNTAVTGALQTELRLDRLCCIGGKQTRFPSCWRRSDGAGEFGEGSREPMSMVSIHAEFVEAAAEILDERVPATDHPC
jgi:hypothetical protein